MADELLPEEWPQDALDWLQADLEARMGEFLDLESEELEL